MTSDRATTRSSSLAGIMLLLGASVLWSLNGALIKLIYQQGQGPDGVTIAFYRSLFAGLFLLPLARGKWHTLGRQRRQPTGTDPDTTAPPSSSNPQPGRSSTMASLLSILQPLVCLRPAALCCILFFTLMTVCFVLANTITEAANVIILQYTSTFWIFGLSPWLLKEKPKLDDLWILGLAMIGIVIIFAGNAATDLVALTIALASGVFFALLTLMIRLMRNSDSAAVMVANNLGSALLLLPVVLWVGHPSLSGRSLILLIFMGVVQFGLPYYLYTLGLVRVPAYQAALLTMAEPVLVPVWTYLAVGETVPTTTLAGGGMIFVALLLFVRAVQTSRRRA